MLCLPRHMWTDFLFFHRGKKRESVWGSGGSFCSKSCVGYRTVFVKQGTVSTSCPVSSLQVQMGQFPFYNGWRADHIKSGIFLVRSTCQVIVECYTCIDFRTRRTWWNTWHKLFPSACRCCAVLTHTFWHVCLAVPLVDTFLFPDWMHWAWLWINSCFCFFFKPICLV